MRRPALAAIAALVVATASLLAAPAMAGAAARAGGTVGGDVSASVGQQDGGDGSGDGGVSDDPDGDPATDDTPLPAQDIIPKPDTGRAPADAGDRGGVLQGVVLLFIVAGVGGMVTLVVRESRRSRSHPT